MNAKIKRYYQIREYFDNQIEPDIIDNEEFETITQEYVELCNDLLYDIMMNNQDVLTRLKFR